MGHLYSEICKLFGFWGTCAAVPAPTGVKLVMEQNLTAVEQDVTSKPAGNKYLEPFEMLCQCVCEGDKD